MAHILMGGQVVRVETYQLPAFRVGGAGVYAGDYALPLKRVAVDARLTEVGGCVVLTQDFANDRETSLETVYIFPLSEAAAVTGFVARVDGLVIRADLQARRLRDLR